MPKKGFYIDKATFERLKRQQEEAGEIMEQWASDPRTAAEGWQPKKRSYDPLKVRKGLIKQPKVEAYTDHKASGLIRILERQEGTLFPEFALYPKSDRKLLTESLKDAGLKEESKGKWVLRTNKFNIFVYT